MFKQIIPIALCSLMLLALGAPKAQLALAAPASVSFTVNSALDEVDNNPGNGVCHTLSNHCTLRAAVMEADFSSGAGATINLPSGIYTLTIPAPSDDGPDKGDLNLSTPSLNTDPLIQIVGAGAASTIIDANQLDRVLLVDLRRTATLSGVTLRGGYVTNTCGGGIYNRGTLTVTNSAITGNQVAVNDYCGGGIYNTRSLSLIQSTVAGNSATFAGGGLFNEGTLLVDRSTIDDNHARQGGGIANDLHYSLTLVNSTLSGNFAVDNGGGIANDGYVDLYSTTIAGNWADSDRLGGSYGGGVYNSPSGTFNLSNSLLVGNNLGNTPLWGDCDGSLHAFGTNIVGLQDDPEEVPAACVIYQPLGGHVYLLNSLYDLSGLQDNGGPTWTIALLAGSSAIMDGGNPVSCTDQNSNPLATDQRGAARVVGGNCDIGAFEFLPPAAYLPFVRR